MAFESRNGGIDSNVYARQVTDTGALRGAAPIAIATSTSPEGSPRISKSDGRGNFNTQAWGVAYTYNGWIVRTRSLTWNGLVIGAEQDQIIGLAVGAPFDISSPTDEEGGQRNFLTVAESTGLPQNGLDIIGRLSDRTTLPLANPISLSELALPTASNARAQMQPSVDCDGVRFLVGYVHDFGAPDYDIDAAVIQRDANQWGNLRCIDNQIVAQQFSTEDQPIVCAAMSGGGGTLRYTLAWDEGNGTNEMIHATRFDGYQPGSTFTTRSTGCGGTVGINATGLPLSGGAFTIQRTGPGFGGFVLGLPVTLPIPGCPGCLQGANGNTLFGDQVTVNVPSDAGFVGLTFAFQGFDLSGGPCLATVAVSDTIDATIR